MLVGGEREGGRCGWSRAKREEGDEADVEPRAQWALWALTSSDFILNKLGRTGERVPGVHNLSVGGKSLMMWGSGGNAVSHLGSGGQGLQRSQ